MGSFKKQIQRFRDILEAYPLTTDHVEDLQLLEYILVEKIRLLLDRSVWFKESNVNDAVESAAAAAVLAELPPESPAQAELDPDGDVDKPEPVTTGVPVTRMKRPTILTKLRPRTEPSTYIAKVNITKMDVAKNSISNMNIIQHSITKDQTKDAMLRPKSVNTLSYYVCDYRTAFGFSYKQHLQEKRGNQKKGEVNSTRSPNVASV